MKHRFQSCYNQLSHCSISDKQKFLRHLRELKKNNNKEQLAQQLTMLERDISHSISQVRLKLEHRPDISFPPSLPVSQRHDEILKAIKHNQVVILCGETGSGKTTQLPKICLQLGLGCKGLIGHTQPRRLAARAVSERIAEELNSPLGEAVGYKVRFHDKTGDNSYIKLMTDGILLAECHHDPYLNQYDTLIIDEAHERSLNIDFLLGYIKRLLEKRKDLKVIITSATIDPESFSTHFNDAPIINVSGRTYPVDVYYRPLAEESNLQQGIADAVVELSKIQRGDILVFLSGERDIRESADYLNKLIQQSSQHSTVWANTEVLPLLARQSASEQNRIFHPGGRRRIILATNVAETSLTVPGIKYVIDSGLARISRYSWRSKIQRLPIEKISQASANQRKGRCGRVSEGICIRLYDEDDFNSRDMFTSPEIQRTNLAAVILQMEHLKLGHINDFPFVEPPEQRLVNDGYKLLHELGALNPHNKVTAQGKKLARLPIDPRLGRMLVEAETEACLQEILIIISALATQDVRERPLEHKQAADEKHSQFREKQSDFMFYLNCWQAFFENKKSLSNNQLRKWCKQNFLSWMRFREWIDTHHQIQTTLKELGFNFNKQGSHYDAIHRSLLSGLLGNVGIKEDNREYTGARNKKFYIYPGSSLFKKSARWIMSAEIVETSRVFARTNANIEAKWIEEKAGHLLKKSYFDPCWQKRQAQVSALEQASLYGLVVYTNKRVNYGPIDPEQSRKIFIYHALMKFEFQCNEKFFQHNKSLIESIQALEAKSRRLDILIDEDDLFSFYDKIIPKTVYNGPLFKQWYKQLGNAEQKQLFLDKATLMQHDATTISDRLFPDYFQLGGMQLPLSYHFDIHHQRDGVTMTIPVSSLNAVNAQHCEWLVPGLLKEKMTALIRSLPKSVRRNFVPAPDFAEACYQTLQASELSLCAAMSIQLKKMTGVDIPYDAWRQDQLDSHFFFNFNVIDSNGKTILEGRNLPEIKDQLSGFTQTEAGDIETEIEQDNVNASILDKLPETVEHFSHGIKVIAYPALVKNGNRVSVKAMVSRQQAIDETRAGLRQLVINNITAQVKFLRNNIPDIQNLCLKYASFGDCNNLKSQIVDTVLDRVFLDEPIRSHDSFKQRIQNGKEKMMDECQRLCDKLDKTLTEYRKVNRLLKKPPIHILDTVTDVQEQLNHLFPENFITQIQPQWLQHYPRYLSAIDKRLQKAQTDTARDRQLRLQLAPLWKDYLQRDTINRKNHIQSEQLEYFRWMLEEFRVSLFAQELKTLFPVSEKRLKAYWQDISDS